jgi:hypothetical protein
MRPDALDVARGAVALVVKDWIERLRPANLDLPVCITGDLDDEVDDLPVGRVRVERDVVPEGDGLLVVFEPDAPVLSCVRVILFQFSLFSLFLSFFFFFGEWLETARTSVLRAPTVLRLSAL